MTAKTAKRSSLFGTVTAEEPIPTVQPIEEPQPTGRRYPVARTREGKRVAATYVSKEALVQLKILAAKEETTVDAILREGLNLVFERAGMSRIA